MSRPGDARERLTAALAPTLAGLLALLLPSLLTTTPDLAGSVTVAVLALALAATVRLGLRHVALAGRNRGAVPPTVDQAVPVSPGRVTDPVHHPLRPRAPGLA